MPLWQRYIQCQAIKYTLSLCGGHSWRVRLSQAGDADSSQAPGLTSGLQGSVNVHRGALLFVPQWRCISSFVFYIILTYYLSHFSQVGSNEVSPSLPVTGYLMQCVLTFLILIFISTSTVHCQVIWSSLLLFSVMLWLYNLIGIC